MDEKVLVLAGACQSTMIYEYEVDDPQIEKVGGLYANKAVGGMGPGKALNFKKLGFSSSLYSVIGDDQPGDLVIDFLEENEIDFYYDIDEQGTNTHINVMNSKGERNAIRIINPSFEPAINLAKIEELIADHDYVGLNVNNFCREAIPLLKKHNKDIWCDLGDYEVDNDYFADFAEACEYVTMSGSKLEDPEQVVLDFIKQGKKQVVVTLGKQGAIGMTQESDLIKVPIIDDFKMVDTNGAGDSFFVGMLYSHIKRYSLEKAMQLSTIVSGLTISSAQLFNEKLSAEYVEGKYREYFA